MSKEVKMKFVGKYESLDSRVLQTLKIKIPYDELMEYYYKLPLFRSVDITVFVKVKDDKPIKLGVFNFDKYQGDKDLEGTLYLKSAFDYVEFDGIKYLWDNRGELMTFMFKAKIEAETEDEDN